MKQIDRNVLWSIVINHKINNVTSVDHMFNKQLILAEKSNSLTEGGWPRCLVWLF